MIKFIQNIGEYFSSNYFDEDFTSKVLGKTGYAADDIKVFNKRISPLKDKFYRFKQLFIEGKLRTKDKIYESHQFHTILLNALGYDGDHSQYDRLFHLSENEVIPVRHILHRGDQAHLMIMEMQALIREDDTDPDGLFEQRYNVEDESQNNPPQKYHRTQWDRVFQVPGHLKISPVIINKAISELFLFEPHLRPKYILLLAGNIVYLLEQEKWFRGSYLVFDVEELFSEATASRNANYYALFYFLLGKESLTPDSNMVLLDQLDEDSHKSAYEVTKDLKEGIIHAVEALANEALYYKKEVLKEEFDETDDTFEHEMKDDCLNIIYRLLFIFYAESREDLDILPSNDPIYNRGYSLEMLRDLEQVPLYSASSMNGYFFHESLHQLFHLLSSGYREKENKVYYDSTLSEENKLKINKSFSVRHIDSPLFNDDKLKFLHQVKFRNKVWQDIICRLSLSKEQRNRTRGRISYANLGINQLGSVYESLLAYRGFYAEQDYIEVHKANAPKDGTYLVPRMRRDDFQENEILKENDEDVITKKGSFVYRLSGRDRQKSASYYTPEVLTRCTVKYTLKPILEKLDKGDMKATELLELKLLEPAMGAAAFHNEMINQLAEAYLTYRQKEMNKRVAPDLYKEELQKIKAYIATNNTYGVDLNPTAIELGKLSLWLNVIHKDMETPFFSNRLAVGNAVVGAWLKVYKEKDIAEDVDARGKTLARQTKKEWWDTAPRQLEFKPTKEYDKIKHGRKPDEIYHFLLPDKNMVPSAGIRMLKAEYDAESKAVTNWKRDFCKPITITELHQLKKICTKIDDLLAEFYRFQRSINIQTANKQEIFGVPVTQKVANLSSYDEKERLADQRNRHNAPYFKLKMVMDYWCSLWFWDVRDAAELPNRSQYWKDIERILELDTDKAVDGIIVQRGQQKLFDTTHQLSMALEPDSAGSGQSAVDSEVGGSLFSDAVVEYTTRRDLFDNNQRLALIGHLANKYFFFHPQLEFLDVFWERGGFDLIAGNPPWVNIILDEGGVVSENYPEIQIRDYSSPEISRYAISVLNNSDSLKKSYLEEFIWAESIKSFLGSFQNYILLQGQRNNLYKCILVNSLAVLNRNGICGLLHPEGVYEDPKARELRKELYFRLIHHFQFKNEILLFAEVMNTRMFSINIYGAKKRSIEFKSISNIFHPITIDQSFVNENSAINLGLKKYNHLKGKFEWNVEGHIKRIINYDDELIEIMSKIFDSESHDSKSVLLPKLQSSYLLPLLKLFSQPQLKIENLKTFVTDCWNEVNSVNDGIILKESFQPKIGTTFSVISSPHIFVNNPFYKNPYIVCSSPKHYECIDLQSTEYDFVQRTNFKINSADLELFFSGNEQNLWFRSFKLAISKMIDPGTERTLQAAIIPPFTTHTNGVISITFENEVELISVCGILSTIVFDFYIKSTGRTNLYEKTLRSIPLLKLSDKQLDAILLRTLRLNCVNIQYAELWERNYSSKFVTDFWSTHDKRISKNLDLKKEWDKNSCLRNYFERRLCHNTPITFKIH